MRFLNLVSCCGKSRPEVRPAASEILSEIPSETRSLVRSPANRRRRKRWRLGGAPSGQSAEWKPSLCSISEENVTFERIDRREDDDLVDRKVRSERIVKRKSSKRCSRSNVSCYEEDYRRSPFPAVIPAFSPTPFMF